MNKTKTIFAALLLSTLLLTNCGGGVSKEVMTADAKKVADVLCKIEKIPTQTSDPKEAAAQVDKAKKESDELIKGMESKYTAEADQKQFMVILDSLQKQCK